MFNKLKPHLLTIVIYVALVQVLYSGGIDILAWQWWAFYGLLLGLHVEIYKNEFDRHFHEQMERCDKCPFHKKVMEDAARLFAEPLFTPPSSAPSAPEDTSPHDPKPPQS